MKRVVSKIIRMELTWSIEEIAAGTPDLVRDSALDGAGVLGSLLVYVPSLCGSLAADLWLLAPLLLVIGLHSRGVCEADGRCLDGKAARTGRSRAGAVCLVDPDPAEER